MTYCIHVHHNGCVYETFCRDYMAAVTVFEALVKDYGAAVSMWKGSERVR